LASNYFRQEIWRSQRLAVGKCAEISMPPTAFAIPPAKQENPPTPGKAPSRPQ